MAESSLPSCLAIGIGEYVTGYVHGAASQSDKKVGVVGLVLFDLRRRGKVGRILLSGTCSGKYAGIREHFAKNIRDKYRDMNVDFEAFPPESQKESDPLSYKKAMDTMKKGDLVFIFTPDDTHYDMVKEAISRGLHVMVTKPAVKELSHHLELVELAQKHNVLVSVEVHKRWDPIYADARQRIQQQLGGFSYFQSYMSQPKKQLITFKSWAGKASDISYYLNSHHVDFHVWSMRNNGYLPTRITATGSTGIAKQEPYGCDTEDTITIMAQWQNAQTGNIGTAVYTASWVAPTGEVHSQQRFHYMGFKGEISADQAHRGYSVTSDETGYASVNPLYMKYTPDEDGYFSGQQGYGYKSLEEFVNAATQMRNNANLTSKDFDSKLATLSTCKLVTAILEAGRKSLDSGNKTFKINYDAHNEPISITQE